MFQRTAWSGGPSYFAHNNTRTNPKTLLSDEAGGTPKSALLLCC